MTMKILLLSRTEESVGFQEEINVFGDVYYTDNLNNIPDINYSLAISYCFGPILKPNHIDLIGCPIVNVHPSFLPYGRGIFPILWSAVLNHPFGVTIHEISDAQIDNGGIISQHQVNINEMATLAQAHRYLMSLSRTHLLELLTKGFPSTFYPDKIVPDQNVASVTYRSRKDGLALLKYLPDKWQTTIKSAREIYKKTQDSY